MQGWKQALEMAGIVHGQTLLLRISPEGNLHMRKKPQFDFSAPREQPPTASEAAVKTHKNNLGHAESLRVQISTVRSIPSMQTFDTFEILHKRFVEYLMTGVAITNPPLFQSSFSILLENIVLELRHDLLMTSVHNYDWSANLAYCLCH